MKEMDDNLLLEYLSGTASKEERAVVEEWYNSSAENKTVLEQLYYTVFLCDRTAVMNNIDTERCLKDFKSTIRSNKGENKMPRRSRLHISRFVVAAALIGVLLSAWGVFKYISVTTTPYIIETGLGGSVHTTLPDGSKVWVGACTMLEYQASFFGGERNVNLNGEAYFDINHRDNIPFIVHSQDLKTEVLGTKFNIRANADEKIVTITLLEGSIAMKSLLLGDDTILMSPQQQFTYNKDTGENKLYMCETAKEYISWIDGKLHFENTTLEEIAKRLESYYNVDIKIVDEALKHEKFTCDFDTKENIYHILSILKMTDKFDYNVEQRHIEIYAK